MEFRKMNPLKDRDTIIHFRKDAYVISFGSVERFGDESTYIQQIKERVEVFSDGYVLIWKNGYPIGQLELRIIQYEGKEIGYVHLYYIIEAYRNKGYGKQLVQYAEAFFRKYHVPEYHLRVSVTNKSAIAFYQKVGMKKIKEEQHQYLVWRMGKILI
ncbi:MAG: GNAT family N-acetyltransferase [Bacillaceae bacterium]